jgi:hypothetical protein
VRSNSDNSDIPLLHIDDNPDDRLLVREAIVLTKTRFRFCEADSLEAAIPYFKLVAGGPEREEYPRPAIILLDYQHLA